jgi:hypothetical protein
LGDVFPALQGHRGVAQITSASQLVGLGMRFNGPSFTTLEAVSNVPQGSKIVRHMANGIGWRTSLLLVNTDKQPAPFTLSFFQENGKPLVLPLGADGNTSTVYGSIAPGQIRIIQTDGSGNELIEGSATLATAYAIGGTAVYTFESGSQPPTETTLPISANASTDLYFPFDQTGSGVWGAIEIALANPGSQLAFVNLSFADDSGKAIATPYAPIEIAGHGHYVSVVGGTISPLAGKRGVVHVKSSFPLTGFGIRPNGDGYTFIPALMPPLAQH